jgi:hypothetical protein
MAILQQNLPANLPASVRFGRPHDDRRPYLVTVPPRKSAMATRQNVAATRQFFALFPHESEDARITGATRSLYRRLLALNLPRPITHVELSERQEVDEVRFTVIDTRIA